MNIETSRQVRRIADLWFESVAEEVAAGSSITSIDSRDKNGVNPFYNRAATGLGVEFYYGSPSQVYTPLGQWHFTGGGGHSGGAQDRAVARFMGKVGLKVRTPLYISTMGEHGPVYDAASLDGVSLPPLTVVPYTRSDDFAAVRSEWDRLTAEYKEEQQAKAA